MKRRALLAALLGFTSWAGACARPDAGPVTQQGQVTSHAPTTSGLSAPGVESGKHASIALADIFFAVNGVAQGDSVAEVRRVLGRPTRIDPARYEGIMDDWLTAWHYPGLSVEFLHGEVEYLECFGRSCRAGGGVGIGDSVDVVVAKYGEPLANFADPGLLKYAYKDRDCGLTFTLVAKRVSKIDLWCDNS